MIAIPAVPSTESPGAIQLDALQIGMAQVQFTQFGITQVALGYVGRTPAEAGEFAA